MSGLEAAGLILGAIPIVVWGLQNYRITRDSWYRSRNKALLIDRLIDALREQQLLIEIDLQILLRAADCADADWELLTTSSCYDYLKDRQLAIAFANYLGRAYEPYQSALKRCEHVVTDIAQCIEGLMPKFADPVSQD